ncbi:hypothetical protein K6W36_12415 [Acetobacter senegalensis]|uniref:phage neck terminator protein n=1 Tax=Acetobacter senegalensis TaxID=446692 RepID=UPI001ED9E197|nr:hypothetical protein [Acetobacter senegalensis]MCG4261369.1 hypothetical protein [Acetobacter senegalensis]
MKPNAPTAGGVIAASSLHAEADADLDLIIGDFVSSVTALPRNLVRRRWQEKPPEQPDRQIDWCAVGVTVTTPDQNANMQWANEQMSVSQHETLEVLLSFYGPNAGRNASTLRMGLSLSQNRAVLQANGMAFHSASAPVRVPSLVNQLWLPRTDITLRIRRNEQRIYPIPSVIESDGTINAEDLTQKFSTENAG